MANFAPEAGFEGMPKLTPRMVASDIVVYRGMVTDEEINRDTLIVDDTVGLMTDIRKINSGLPILHASISAKWTMRSDRAQNSRTEALG